MVYFVCEGCNETLKKAQVEKHASRCRQCHAVTCVDCSQTFYGNDFEGHTTCISEAEKYEGALYKKPGKQKQNPQDVWMGVVEEAARSASGAPAAIKTHLARLCDFGNVPRNQKKFINFCQNSMRIHSEPIINQIWKHLEDLRSKSDSLSSDKTPPFVPGPASVPEKEPEQEQEQVAEKDSKKRKKDKLQRLEAAPEAPAEREDEDVEERQARKEAKRARKEAKRARKA